MTAAGRNRGKKFIEGSLLGGVVQNDAYNIRETYRRIGPKLLRVLAFGTFLGIFDGLQAKFFNVGSLGHEAAVLYQGFFFALAGVLAGISLYDKNWSLIRNATNFIMTIPMATIGDNVSIDVQTLKPYILVIPRQQYVWRTEVFERTRYSPIAIWVNHQALVTGVLDGYLLAIGMAAAYVLLQYLLTKRASRYQ